MADYAESIVAYFVARRGRGASLSATDQALLSNWEATGVPVEVVVLGLERAFDALRQPPRSLSECRRWVTAAVKAHAHSTTAEGDAQAMADEGAAPAEAASAVQPGHAQAADADAQLVARLECLCAAASDPRVAQALHELAEDVRALLADGPLSTEVLAVLDQTLVEGFLAGLPADEQTHAARAVEAAVAADPRAVGSAAVVRQQLVVLHQAAWVRARYPLPIVDVGAG